MTIKAISLISGGLDSTLATKVVKDQGVEVIAVNFVSPFCRCNRKGGCGHEAKAVSEQLGIPLKVVNIFDDFLKMLRAPKHGYGSHMNPCIDCRILMLRKAAELMHEIGASFLITGEVLGQRPMSQRRDALRVVEKDAGVLGLVLRPLSAKLLPPTIPEEKGWVDREKLLDIAGRGRKVQMQMADDFNIKDYPCPAGGCVLTDPAFSRRVKDLIDHDGLTMEHVRLLNYGRHFRLTPTAKLVVGKDERENSALAALATPEDYLFAPPEEVPGATGFGKGDLSEPQVRALALGIVTRYFDKDKIGPQAPVIVRHAGREETVAVTPFTADEVQKYLI